MNCKYYCYHYYCYHYYCYYYYYYLLSATYYLLLFRGTY